MPSKLKINLEAIFLLIFIITFLTLGLANKWDNRIKHDFPYSYGASDAFFHASVAQYMKEQGRVKFTPPYEVGGYKDVFDAHPPMLFQLTGVFSTLTGLKAYDGIYFITLIAYLFSILILYIIIRQFNRNIALLTLPFTLLIFKNKFLISFHWGYWMLIVGILFMVFAFWSLTRLKLKNSYILIGIILASLLIAHQPEAVFIAIFIALFLVVDIIKNKKLDLKKIKTFIISGIIALILSFYSLNIFLKTFVKTEGYRKKFETELGSASIFIKDLGIILIILAVIGLIFFILSKKKHITGYFGIYMFIVSYLTFIGLGKRAATHRFFWHLYLGFFFALAIYQLIKLFWKKFDLKYSFALSIVILIILAQPLYAKTKFGQGIMDPYNWEGLNYVANNIPEDAFVYYFYSDGLSQAATLYNSKRLAFKISTDDFIEGIKSQKIRRNFGFGLADSYHTYLCPLGFLSLGYYRLNPKPLNQSFKCEKGYEPLKGWYNEEKDICDLEYMYFNKITSQPVLGQYNQAIIDTLTKKEWVEEIFSNEVVSILKNNKPGVECLE